MTDTHTKKTKKKKKKMFNHIGKLCFYISLICF